MSKENFNENLNVNSEKDLSIAEGTTLEENRTLLEEMAEVSVQKKTESQEQERDQELGQNTLRLQEESEASNENNKTNEKNKKKRKNKKEQKFYQLTDTEYAKKEKRKIYLLSFLVPFFILALSWAGSDFYPLGVRTPLTIDLYHQYAPFLSEIRYKLLHGEDFFFTWHIGLGTNFFALLSYYLASPLNILMVLFPLEHLTTAVAILTLIKIGLAGLFMAIFINEAIFDRRADKASFPSLLKKQQIEDRRQCIVEEAISSKKFLFNLRRDGIRASVIIALSTAYAVSAFNLSYAWNIMWLDAIALMPLLLLGQDRLLRKKKPFLYIITLAIMLIANYYVSFFNLLYVALYFFVLSFSIIPSNQRVEKAYRKYQTIKKSSEPLHCESTVNNNKNSTHSTLVTNNLNSKAKKLPFKYSNLAEFLRQGFSLLGASLLGLGLSAILLVPTILSLRETSASGDSFPSSNEFRYSILHFLSRSIIGSSPSIRDGLPNIYIGMLVLLVIPIFFISKKISRREKALHAGLLVFMFLSLNSSVLNFIWHGFHYPNQLPHRFAYLYGLTLIIMAARALVSIEESKKQLKFFRIAVVSLIILAIITEELFWDDWSSTVIYLAIACLFFYFILSYYFEKKKVIPRLLASMFLIVFVAELSLNGISMIQQVNDNEYFTKRPDFIRDMQEVESLLEEAREDSRERSASEDKSAGVNTQGKKQEDFYRMEYMPAKTTNDPSLFSYNGFTLFASTSNENVAKLFRKLGYHGNNINSYKYVASTNFMDSLFRIRYLILRDKELSNNQYELISETKNATQNFKLYRNKYELPFSLILDKNIDNWLEEDASPFTYQNQLYNLGLYSDLKNKTSETEINTTEEKVDKNENGETKGEIFEHLLVNEVKLNNFTAGRKDANLGYAFNAGEKGPKSKISLEIPVDKDMHVYFFVKVVRSLKVNYSVSSVSGNGNKVDSPEPKAPTASEQEEEKKKKVELKDNREINKPEIFDVGECKKGDTIKVDMEFVDDLDNPVFWAAGVENKKLEKAYLAFNNRDAGIGKVDNRHLAGTVNLSSDKTILIPIPYDKGWNVMSDGEQIETFALGSGLLAFHLGSGSHNVTLEFTPNGMLQAVIIFLVSLILLLILYLYLRFISKKKINNFHLCRDVECMSDETLLKTIFNYSFSQTDLEVLNRAEVDERTNVVQEQLGNEAQTLIRSNQSLLRSVDNVDDADNTDKANKTELNKFNNDVSKTQINRERDLSQLNTIREPKTRIVKKENKTEW